MSESKIEQLLEALDRHAKILKSMRQRWKDDGNRLDEMTFELREIRNEVEWDDSPSLPSEQRVHA